jgi:non-ribosomal peptide synthetase component F
VAVVFENEQLTYRELNSRANQLARYLQKLGVGREVRVGICVERSLEMVVGLLGVLKAGGAYVPLDPAYPQERVAFMLKDAQVSILLTQQDSWQAHISHHPPCKGGNLAPFPLQGDRSFSEDWGGVLCIFARGLMNQL